MGQTKVGDTWLKEDYFELCYTRLIVVVLIDSRSTLVFGTTTEDFVVDDGQDEHAGNAEKTAGNDSGTGSQPAESFASLDDGSLRDSSTNSDDDEPAHDAGCAEDDFLKKIPIFKMR